MTRAPLLLAALIAGNASANVTIPSPPGDQGVYTLLEEVHDGPLIRAMTRRVGPSGSTWTWTEINCSSRQYRFIADSFDGPDSPKGPPGNWSSLVPGSSKSALASFVCSRRASGVTPIGKP